MTDPIDKVLDLVAAADYKPLTLKAISRRLGIAAEDYSSFRSAVKGLLKDGRLEIGKDKRLSKPHTKGMIIGTFRRSAKGFGFVRPPQVAGKDRPDLHPDRAEPRCFQRRRGRRQDHQAAQNARNERRRADHPGSRPGFGGFRRDLF